MAKSKKDKKSKRDTTMPTDAELLVELATIDHASAQAVTYNDHLAGAVPAWCELVLELRRSSEYPLSIRSPLRRHDAELIIEVLGKAVHPDRPGSTSTMLMAELDKVIEELVNGDHKKVERARLRGLAEGLTLAIAVSRSPYAYDTEAVREEAMARRTL